MINEQTALLKENLRNRIKRQAKDLERPFALYQNTRRFERNQTGMIRDCQLRHTRILMYSKMAMSGAGALFMMIIVSAMF